MALAVRSLETIHFGHEYCGRALSLRRAANGEMEMNAQATKLQAAENDLKQLMADVSQAMEKAQEAVARIASNAAAATTETESTSR
jgi:t-SNARE complex subunit (syntaxin)